MTYDASASWNQAYIQKGMAYPSEYLIRIFKGKYPKHAFDAKAFSSSRILDISCGDGRNLPMLKGCGFQEVYGTEISEEIVLHIRNNLEPLGFAADRVQVGCNHSLPFENDFFDYAISWNSCYYMQDQKFEAYVGEFARVIKPGGVLVLSIPKSTCFIYQGAEDEGNGYRIIRDDYFDGMRNGERMRCFKNEREIAEAFTESFEEFRFASIHDDCFGLNYHWYLAICQRR